MTLSKKPSTAFLLLFFLLTVASTTAEFIKSPADPSENQNFFPRDESSHVNKTCTLAYPSQNSLFFKNCDPQFLVKEDVRSELSQTGGDTREDHYSTAQKKLSTVYIFLSLLHSCYLGIWTCLCFKVNPRFRSFHLSMGGLLAMKSMKLLCTALKVRGNDLFYASRFISLLHLFILILLLRTGCSYLRTILHENEKRVLINVIRVQVLANLGSIMIGGTGSLSKDWENWNPMKSVVDVFCTCGVLFSISWLMIWLMTKGGRITISERLNRVRDFYKMIMLYLWFMKAIRLLRIDREYELNTKYDYREQFKSTLALELNVLAFYMVIFRKFREFFELYGEEEEETT